MHRHTSAARIGFILGSEAVKGSVVHYLHTSIKSSESGLFWDLSLVIMLERAVIMAFTLNRAIASFPQQRSKDHSLFQYIKPFRHFSALMLLMYLHTFSGKSAGTRCVKIFLLLYNYVIGLIFFIFPFPPLSFSIEFCHSRNFAMPTVWGHLYSFKKKKKGIC